MIESFLMVAPRLWPHALLIVVASLMGVQARSLLTSTGAGAGLAMMAMLAYLLIQNGIAPDSHALILGQLVGLFLAGAVPLVGAASAGQLAHHAGARRAGGIVIGVVTGLLLLVPMPFLQERLGCGISGICP